MKTHQTTPMVQVLNHDLMREVFSYVSVEDVHNFMVSKRSIYEDCVRDEIYKIVHEKIVEGNQLLSVKEIYNPQSRVMEKNNEEDMQQLKNISKNYRKELVKYFKGKRITKFCSKKEILDIKVDTQQLKTFTTRRDVKLLITGDGAVGKTTFLKTVALFEDPESFIPVILDSYEYKLENISFSLWDSAGQEDYDKLRPLSYPETDIFLIAYSVDKRDSYLNLKKKFIREVRYHEPNAVCALVACKIDLRTDPDSIKRLKFLDEKHITHEEGVKLAKHLNCISFLETSSLTKEGLEDIGDFFTKLYYYKMTQLKSASSKSSRTCFLQ